MRYREISETDMRSSVWSGGTTTEIAIFPENAMYAERDFLWRVSTAKVELDESDFTRLPEYERLIAVVEGGMRLTHAGAVQPEESPEDSREKSPDWNPGAGPDGSAKTCGDGILITPLDTIHRFDGGTHTHCVGRAVDLNLMLRKGKVSGSMEFLHRGEYRRVRLRPNETVLLYSISERHAWLYGREDGADSDDEIELRAQNGCCALFRMAIITQ